MILGYNTNGFASHRLDDAIAIIAGLGYRAIAITVDHHALDPYVADAQAARRHCAELLREHDLLPVVETGARFLLDPWRKHRPTLLEDAAEERERRIDFLLRCLDIAEAIGARVLSLWSGAAPTGASPEELDDRLRAGLERVCQRAGELGITIAFEPEPGMYIESMADFDRLCTGFSPPALALTLDLGHAHLTESSVEDTVRRYAGRIANVHVEGMRQPYHDHLPPWDSGFDVRAALAQLEEQGYAGPATLELSRSSHQAVDIARRAYEFLSS